MKIDRRSLVKYAGSMALISGFTCAPLFARPLGTNPFALGVASGDPWPDGFVIWTRLAPRPLDEHGGMPAVRVPVRWEVAEDDGFARVVRQGEAIATPELAHSVHVEVEGLQPHRRYWYRFAVAGSDSSPVGTVRTAPAADAIVDRLRIGVAGCQHFEYGYYDAWSHLSQETDLDLVFHYGDYIYEGGQSPLGRTADGKHNIVRQHVGDEIYSIDDYRRRYAQYRHDPHLQAAHAACAFAVSFDDHEIDNNWTNDIDQDGTAPEIFTLRRLAGLQAWYEHMPVRKAQFPTPAGLTAFRRLDYGRLLRMHVLDTRSYRSDQPCNDIWIPTCPAEERNAPDFLGKEQEAWLDQGFAGAHGWNLLAQQTIMMPVNFRAVKEGGVYNPDQWDGYRSARARLIDSIRKHNLTNVIVATGDYHKHVVGSVPERDDEVDGKKVAVEFVAAAISTEGNGQGVDAYPGMMSDNPHFSMHADRRGYQLFEITPESWTSHIKIMDQVEAPGGKISTHAKFIVTPDAPALHKA